MKILPLFFLSLLFFNCTRKPEAKGTPVSFKDACSGKYWAKPIGKGDFKGERIAFPGHLFFSSGLQTDTILLDLYETTDKKGKPIQVSVRVDGEKNGIDSLPKEVKQSDLRIHTNNGQTVGAGDKVIVHGEHIGDDTTAPICLFEVFLIENG